MSTTALAIFVKTPSLSPVKTRLAAGVGKQKAEAFYRLSLKAVLGIVTTVAVEAHWALAEQQAVNDPLWQTLPLIHTGEGGLGERQHHVYETLLANYARVLLIGADTPQISQDILNQAIAALHTNDFVIGPARDGGYYLFGGRVRLEQKIWSSVSWSTSTTREQLEAGLLKTPVHLPVLTDVDTQDDLPCVIKEMPEHPSKEQIRLQNWIRSIL